MADLTVSDHALESAIGRIVSAVDEMLDGNRARPADGFDSLTGIGGEVDRYLRGAQVGRAALADAARTAGQGLRHLMQEAERLDSGLAESLGADFAVQGARR